jgi:hypothetical protein
LAALRRSREAATIKWAEYLDCSLALRLGVNRFLLLWARLYLSVFQKARDGGAAWLVT